MSTDAKRAKYLESQRDVAAKRIVLHQICRMKIQEDINPLRVFDMSDSLDILRVEMRRMNKISKAFKEEEWLMATAKNMLDTFQSK